MNKIAFAGNMIVDYVKKIDSYPRKGMLSSIREVSRCVGGCACNTAVGFARFDGDMSVTAIGRLGDDENGRYIRQALENENIRCKIAVDPKLPTSFTDVMSEIGGDRTFFHARGANAAFGPVDVAIDELDCDLLHIGYILLLDALDADDPDYGTAMARLLQQIRARGIKTSVDVVSESSGRFQKIVIPSLPHCDYLIINEVEATQITGLAVDGTNAKAALQKLLDMGVQEMAVIHAPEGGWAMTKTGEFAFAASLALPRELMKGHVGAGDAFCAGMLYGICKGFDLATSLEFAAGAAACNLTEANSIDGMRDYGATMEMIRQWI